MAKDWRDVKHRHALSLPAWAVCAPGHPGEPMKTPLVATLLLLTLASVLPATASADTSTTCIQDPQGCVDNARDYATHCGIIPLYDVAICWFTEGGVWYDFAVNGVVVDLVTCTVVGGPACLQPVCQPISPLWPRYCSPADTQ